jgi:small subunit ribosomal protein S3
MGRLGVKVWIYKGDILPEAKEEEAAETAAIAQPAAGAAAAPAPSTVPAGTEGSNASTKAS